MDEEVLQAFYSIISPQKIELYEKYAAMRTRHVTVVLENIFQEHNASAILRNCEAFGIQDLHTIEKKNVYKVQRDIARGAGRWVDLHNYTETDSPTQSCLKKLKTKGYKIVATTPHEKETTLDELPISEPLALVFGTEKEGISQEVKDHADYFVKIPMYGFSESFNVSVSTALALQKLRERLQSEKIDFLISQPDQTLLKIHWCTKIIREGGKIEQEIRKRILEIKK